MTPEEVDIVEDEITTLIRKQSVASIADHDDFVESTKDQRRTITVEPLVLFYVILLYLQSTVMGQYIYYRIGVDYNITTNGSLAYVCDRNDNSTAEREKTDRLQDINSSYSLYMSLASAICTILTAPFYSVFSDRFGRRLLFVLPGIGSLLKSLFEVLLMYFKWPLYVFVVTEGLFGLFGGFGFATALASTYIADISTSMNRTKRLSILVAIMGLGALIISLVSGYWITAQGYLIPYIFSAVVALLCLFYPILILKEPPRMPEATKIHLPPLQQLQTLVTIYLGRPRYETVILILIVVMFNFYYVAEMSTLGLMGTYLMALPLCMTSIMMSYFSFVILISVMLGMAISIIILARFLPELVIILLCHISGFAFAIQMAFATGPAGAFIAAITNLFSFSAFQFIRGFLSKQVGPFEQGALFGGLLLCETVGGAITKIVVMYFYKETFRTFHGMVYIFISSFSVVAFILTLPGKLGNSRKKKNW